MKPFRSVPSLAAIILSIATTSALALNTPIKSSLQARANPPLNTTLAYYKLPGHNSESAFLTHAFVPVSCGANLSVHYVEPSIHGKLTGTAQKPVLLLGHGFPESSYMWKDTTLSLSKRVPVFAYDQPGYGLSTPCKTGRDQLTAAQAVVEAVTSIYGNGTAIVMAGHDRGARTMQRMALHIDDFPQVKGLGVLMIETVPLVPQYQAFSNPSAALRDYHFSLLPRGQFAIDIISAYGGSNYVSAFITAAAGTNTVGRGRLLSGDALKIYGTFMDQLATRSAIVLDFVAQVTVDYQREIADQQAGRKISIPTMVIYSTAASVQGLGLDPAKAWADYVNPSANLATHGIGNGHGHFLLEETPDQVVDLMNRFLSQLGVE